MKTLSTAISKAAAESSTVLHYFYIFFVQIDLTSPRHLDKNCTSGCSFFSLLTAIRDVTMLASLVNQQI